MKRLIFFVYLHHKATPYFLVRTRATFEWLIFWLWKKVE